MKFKWLCLFLMVGLVISCGQDDLSYTMYRTGYNSVTDTPDEAARIHVATFDAKDNGLGRDGTEAFNRANCDLTQELSNKYQPTFRKVAAVRYWCEKGTYRK